MCFRCLHVGARDDEDDDEDNHDHSSPGKHSQFPVWFRDNNSEVAASFKQNMHIEQIILLNDYDDDDDNNDDDYDDNDDDHALGDTVVGGNDDGSSEDDYDDLVELIKFTVSLHAQDP